MNVQNYRKIKESLPFHVKLVAVSKTKPIEDILALYHEGQRLFGENKAQELIAKYEALPQDIKWHFIGHLQSNKIKYIAPFVSLIHSIDSLKLLQEVNKQAMKNDRIIPCLLQFHIALEETKFGFSIEECEAMLADPALQELKNIVLVGVMGMATFTDDEELIRGEFIRLKKYFDQLKSNHFLHNPDFKEISMGMTDDYAIAMEEGSTLIRIGSAIFGTRINS
ncbi:MAG: YggS family pyridoxal phosphate-dependent enzyme [Bacteroidales bacterium]|nr:YggS family pyridoxal phosphate-dependent enzyme [Bacteroidales bacterium]